MNTLPSSLFSVIPSILRYFTGKLHCLQILYNTVVLNSYLGISSFSKNFLDLYKMGFDKGGNSLPEHFERTANILACENSRPSSLPARVAFFTLPHGFFFTKKVLQNLSQALIYYRGNSLKRFRY